jgi:hypothetical protein
LRSIEPSRTLPPVQKDEDAILGHHIMIDESPASLRGP